MRLKRVSSVVAGLLAATSVPANSAVVMTGTALPDSSGLAWISYEFGGIAGLIQRVAVDIFSGVINSAAFSSSEYFDTDDIHRDADGSIHNDGNNYTGDISCTLAGGVQKCEGSSVSFPTDLAMLGSGTAIFQTALPYNQARCAEDQVGCFAIYNRVSSNEINVAVKSAGPVAYRISYDAFSAAVPEPASWAMMIAGFGMIGLLMRKCELVTA